MTNTSAYTTILIEYSLYITNDTYRRPTEYEEVFKKYAIVVLATSVLLSQIGCSVSTSTDSPGAIRIAYFPNITHAPALIAKDQGLFEKVVDPGINIDYREFNSGTSEIEAFFAGELDLGYIGPGPAINGFIKSQGDLVVIAGAAEGGSLLIARPGLAVSGPQDFAGKTIGVPNFGNTQDLLLRKYLADNNLQDMAQGGTVKIIQANNPDIQGLFDQKHLDLAIVPEPWGAILTQQAGAQVILTDEQIWPKGTYPTTMVIARREFAEAHPDLVQAFLLAHLEAIDLLQADPAAAGQSVARQIALVTGKDLPEAIVADSFSRITFTAQLDQQAMADFARIMESLEFIPAGSSLTDLYQDQYLPK